MAIRAITESLVLNRMISAVQRDALNQIQSSTDYMERLTSIFEEKISTYISACHPFCKKELVLSGCPDRELEAKINDKIISDIFSFFSERDKFSFIGFMQQAITIADLDVSISAGLSCLNASDNRGVLLAKKGLVEYLAKQGIFRAVDVAALHEICAQLEETNPRLFPMALLRGFEFEVRLSELISRTMNAGGRHSNEVISDSFLEFAHPIFEIARSHLLFLTQVLSSQPMEQRLLEERFFHVTNPEHALAFSSAVAGEFVRSMQNQALSQRVITSNQQAVESDLFKKCRPALKILGCDITIDFSSFDRAINSLDQQILKSSHLKKEIEDAKARDLATLDQNLKTAIEMIKRSTPVLHVGLVRVQVP